jgi:predicted ester cyclase
MTNREVIDSYVGAWRERDPEKIAAHFADDGVRRWEMVVPPVIGGPNRFKGPRAIAEPIRSLIAAIPDITTEIPSLVETDGGAVLEFVHAGTHQGDWNKWTAQGEHVEFSGVCVYQVADDKISEECIYFDPDLLVREWVPPLTTLMGVGLGMWKQGRATKKARAVA